MLREERKIEQVKAKLTKLGPMLPGSISEQWNVCGTPGCQCKDPVKPVKHGPYYQLSFTMGGKSSTMFVKKEDLAEVKRRLKRYKQFKALNVELVQAHIALSRRTGFGKEQS